MYNDLYYGSFNGDLELVKRSISHGVSINCKHKDGSFAICQSSQMGHLEIVRLLLLHGADINCKNKSGDSAFLLCSSKGFLDIASLLILSGADIHIKNKDGMTALLSATIWNHIDVIELLLLNNADVNTKRNVGYNAFYYASQNDHCHILQFLYNNQQQIQPVQVLENTYDQAIDFSSFKGVQIEKTELRGITINQLKMVMNEMHHLCRELQSSWKKFDGQLIEPHTANLYDIVEPIIKKRTAEKKCSFVELVSTDSSKQVWCVYEVFVSLMDANNSNDQLSAKNYKFEAYTQLDHIQYFFNNSSSSNIKEIIRPAKAVGFIRDGLCYRDNADAILLSSPNASNLTDVTANYYTSLIADSEESVNLKKGGGDHKQQLSSSEKVAINNISIRITKEREKWFDKDRLRKAMNFDVIQAEATQELDRKHILNAITQQVDMNIPPLAYHKNYDELNFIIQSGYSRLLNYDV
eukprot:gene10842-14553_t